MRRTLTRFHALAALFFCAVAPAFVPPAHAPVVHAAQPDVIAAEIARWLTIIRADTRTDELWVQVKPGAQAELERAEQALRDGRHWFALERLAAARPNLAAAYSVSQRPIATRTDAATFEAEWTRAKATLGDAIPPCARASLDEVRPAAVRALAEIACAQVRVLYDASIEYGRNTTPESGFFYLEAARAQREFAEFCRTLSTSSSSSPERASPAGSPPPRGLTAEIENVEGELLAAYRPPASIARHADFIAASGTLKEARELDAAGLHDGALLRYLQASLRVTLLRAQPAARDGRGPAVTLREAEPRLAAVPDPSLARIFVERAQADLDRGADTGALAAAEAVSSVVLPRYFASLEPAAPRPARPAPRVTVTLVRWPFT
jgi:hypothetical protein